MPADYSSTARALALPVSPPQSPITSHQAIRPSWSRSQGSRTRFRSQSPYQQSRSSFRHNLLEHAVYINKQALTIYNKLKWWQALLAVLALGGLATLSILFLINNEAIFRWLEPYAEKWQKMNGGWLILWLMTFATAFPPMIGYSTCTTIAGFVYGFPGWFIIASATIAGSLCSFIVSRTILSNFVNRLVASDKRFAALSLVLKHDGLKLLVMIRLCPLPYSLSNGAISTFPTVKPLTFALATAIATPKLLIHVFIGTRLAAVARSGGEKDATTKVVNYMSIVFGAVLGAATGYIIYQRTLARSRTLEAEERAKHHRSPYPRNRPTFTDNDDDDGSAGPINNSNASEIPNQEQNLANDDDIDFLDTNDGDESDNWNDYRDESEFEEEDDEENAIGMRENKKMHGGGAR